MKFCSLSPHCVTLVLVSMFIIRTFIPVQYAASMECHTGMQLALKDLKSLNFENPNALKVARLEIGSISILDIFFFFGGEVLLYF